MISLAFRSIIGQWCCNLPTPTRSLALRDLEADSAQHVRGIANRKVKIHSVNSGIQLCGSPNRAVTWRIGLLVLESGLGKELW